MIDKKNELRVMRLLVPNWPTITILANESHDLLIPDQDIIAGCGIGLSTLQINLHKHKGKFIEGQHYLSGITLSDDISKSCNLRRKVRLFTREGITLLYSTLKSNRAKQFLSWAEKINKNNCDTIEELTNYSSCCRYFTQDMMLSIISEVCKIEDNKIRLSLIAKLTGIKP